MAAGADSDAASCDAGFPRWRRGPEGLAERFARRVGTAHPVGGVLRRSDQRASRCSPRLSLLLGLLVTDVLVHVRGLGLRRERVVESLAADRTPFLTDASAVGTAVGGAPVLPILAGLIAIVCAFMRRWLIAGFAAFVLVVESATYRVSSLVVPRERPYVHRLEDLPGRRELSVRATPRPRSRSMPASCCCSRRRSRSAELRIAAWALAVVLPPIVVAMSRMYRGMHHPLDVASGVLVGIGAITVLLFACRAASCAQRARAPRSARRARVPAARGPRDERRGRRPCGEASRRRPSGVAPRARVRGIETRCGTRCRRPRRPRPQVERALDEGAELVFAWGGDGMVRRCVGVMAGGDAELAVLPAGTSNLFADQPGDPEDIKAAVAIGAARRDAAARRRPLQGRALRA